MKKILISIATCAMIITTGCSNEEIVSEMSDSQNFTLNVSVGANSRTFNGEDGKCLWGANEQIYVTSEDGKVFGTLSMVSITDDKKSAVFSGPINGRPDQLKYTIYPKPDNNGEIKVSVNGENHNAPMYGNISGGNSQFKYAGGLVKLSMKGAKGAKVNVPNTQTDPNAIGGTYKFNLQKGEMEYHPGSTPVGIESIPADGVVYLPVATTAIVNGQKQNIDKVDLDIFIGSNLTPVSISDVPVETNMISTDKVPNIEVDANGTVNPGIVVTTEDALSTAISSYDNIKLGTSFNLTSDLSITGSGDITLDLNGYELKGNIVNNGNLTIVDNKIPNGKRNLEDVLTITMGGNDAQLNMNNNAVGSIRINNTALSNKFYLPENHEYIVYYEHNGNSNLYTWYSLNINANNKIINTFVIGEGKTFTFDDSVMAQLVIDGVATEENLVDVVKAYFSEYSMYVTRLELKNGSTLSVVANSEAASGYKKVIAEGDVTISGASKDNSSLLLCGGSTLEMKTNSEVHVNNITIQAANNGDGSRVAYVKPSVENIKEGEAFGKIYNSNSYIKEKKETITENYLIIDAKINIVNQ